MREMQKEYPYLSGIRFQHMKYNFLLLLPLFVGHYIPIGFTK